MNKQSPISLVLISLIKIGVIITIAYAIYTVAMKAYDFGYRISTEPPALPGSENYISFTVLGDEEVKDIGKNLEELGLILDANIFVFQEWFSKYEGDIKPGIYRLSPSMTGEEMIQIMATPPVEEEIEEGEYDS